MVRLQQFKDKNGEERLIESQFHYGSITTFNGVNMNNRFLNCLNSTMVRLQHR